MTTVTTSVPASDRQLFALYAATKVDYRGKGLSKETATLMLQAANQAKGYVGKTKASGKVPAALGTSPTVAGGGKPKGGAKLKAKKKAKPAEFKITKEFRQQCAEFMLQASHVQALFKTLFGATALVEGLTNDVTGKDTGFVLVGGGCGFGIVEGYRKTAKNELIRDLAWGYKEELNQRVRALMPAELVTKLERVGNPVQALQCQCELYNATFASLVAGYMESLGIKGVYSTSRAD